MLGVLVAADDRTGALEVAAACADRLGATVTVVTAVGDLPLDGAAVVDLGSRHVPPAEAAARAAAVDGVPATRRAHKIDSALRGNWAAEVLARTTGGRRGAVVAALPALGRVCAEGGVLAPDPQGAHVPVVDVVTDDGPERSSRPGDHLTAAGAAGVVAARDADELARWLQRAAAGVAVCDARTDADVDALGRVLAGHPDVLVAGTAAGVSAALATRWRSGPTWPGGATDRVLVVCGSAHPTARAQLDVLRDAHLAGVTILAPPPNDGAGSDADVGRRLADEARRLLDEQAPGAVVVVGGDTAAAVLGPDPVDVHGTLTAGVAVGRRRDGQGPWIASRAGSFGGDGALAELVGAIMGR